MSENIKNDGVDKSEQKKDKGNSHPHPNSFIPKNKMEWVHFSEGAALTMVVFSIGYGIHHLFTSKKKK